MAAKRGIITVARGMRAVSVYSIFWAGRPVARRRGDRSAVLREKPCKAGCHFPVYRLLWLQRHGLISKNLRYWMAFFVNKMAIRLWV